MAIDQTPTSSPAQGIQAAAIDNEFPAYRAISALAVTSLVLGLASVFSFADLWFLLLVAGSLITGWMALRKIARLPEILTGASFARVGMGISLLFGLSAITHEVAQEILTSLEARRFAMHYIDIIKDKPVSMALWYEQNVDYRKNKTPDEIADEVKKSKNPATTDPYGAKAEPITQIKQRLKSAGQDFRYAKVESKAVVGLTIYANVLCELDGPATKEYPNKQYALIQMTKTPGVGAFDWVVQDFKFPYKPESVAVEVPHASDDGHGHAGGH